MHVYTSCEGTNCSSHPMNASSTNTLARASDSDSDSGEVHDPPDRLVLSRGRPFGGEHLLKVQWIPASETLNRERELSDKAWRPLGSPNAATAPFLLSSDRTEQNRSTIVRFLFLLVLWTKESLATKPSA
ncbi:hypothetical protein AXG93_1276s1060 [Marchantia polymorpha subsp. ruderalis]|uniref:Uncharacterized protein n=1 Tax=Marchantia polymorpha subsp. ruderalis TaxID=1480154 RepID=A0A176WHP6_MARPO|nr:hypothetical protein AXG93_1276s1060 [Marchantia polymorpha subsp. ruderalis]